MTDESVPIPIRRGRGRPRKNPLVDREPKREPLVAKMKARPNWETMGDGGEDSPDRLSIPRELIPEGMSLLWVTDAVYGQSMPQHRAKFERRGWTPVHQSDFDGAFDGMFMPKGREGEINVDGACVLMARPKELTDKARRLEKIRANEVVQIKEQALRGGDLPVSQDPQHPSAVRTNRINRTFEKIEIPE